MGTTAILIIVGIVILIIAIKGIRVVRPWQKGLVERLGKYQCTVDSGVTVILPFLDSLLTVDMREQVVDVPPQGVITKDNVVVEVDAVVYYEVTDPVKVTCEALQMHGGIGMTDEEEIGFFLKRARAAELFLGDASHHRDRFATLQGF